MAKQATTRKRAAPSAKPAKPGKSKTDIILGLLRRKSGASIEEMGKATGWQAHSVRGFLSGTVRKKLALALADEKPEGGVRRYFIRAS